MKLIFNHSLLYTNTGIIPVNEVADSLLANETLIKNTGIFLENCIEGLLIERIEVDFKQATHASPLKELFLASLMVAYQKDLKREVPQIIQQITGMKVPHQYETLITVSALILAFYGVDYLYHRFISDKKSEPITKGIDQLVVVAGDFLQISPDKVHDAAHQTMKGTRKLSIAKATKRLIAPAKREKEAIIQAEGGYEISRPVINAVPSEIDLEEEDTLIQEPYQNIEILLRAEDADRSKQGWAGIPVGVHEERLKMEIYPTVNKDDIFGKKTIRGDIILVSRRQQNDNYTPMMFHLVNLK